MGKLSRFRVSLASCRKLIEVKWTFKILFGVFDIHKTTNSRKFLHMKLSKILFPENFQQKTTLLLREKCPYLEFFWSVFSHIRTRNMDEILVNTDAVSVNQFWVNLSIYINTLNWILCHECKNLENEKIENWTKETMFSRLALGFYYAIFEGMHRISIFFWKIFLYS